MKCNTSSVIAPEYVRFATGFSISELIHVNQREKTCAYLLSHLRLPLSTCHRCENTNLYADISRVTMTRFIKEYIYLSISNTNALKTTM